MFVLARRYCDKVTFDKSGLDDVILLFLFNNRNPLSVIIRTMERSRRALYFIFYINLCPFYYRKIYVCSGSQIF